MELSFVIANRVERCIVCGFFSECPGAFAGDAADLYSLGVATVCDGEIQIADYELVGVVDLNRYFSVFIESCLNFQDRELIWCGCLCSESSCGKVSSASVFFSFDILL